MNTSANNYDLLIIGGGINGVGIAADAAQRGLKVILCEQHDFASATSSASSKLIHGGLRYLEQYEFRLVREALMERQCLMNLAPHLIKPLEFIAPYATHMRPAWLMRIGLFIYDHLYWHNRLPRTKKVTRRGTPQDFASLTSNITFGFSYYDCSVLDARLVIVNALAARNHGAQLYPRTTFITATRQTDHWQATMQTQQGTLINVQAKCLVNAAGPWVEDILKKLNIHSAYAMRLVQGSHIIVPKLYDGNHAYILQNDDGRIIFTIPYHFNTTLIGTTDVTFSGNPYDAHITPTEQAYLCRVILNYFNKTITADTIIHSYCGVRPLLADDSATPAEITRDYKLALDDAAAPLLSIFGGKITTYRKLAEKALDSLRRYFPHMRSSITAHTPLPGGNMQNNDINAFAQAFMQRYPWLDREIGARYINSYGTLAHEFLHDCQSMQDLGKHFGAGLFACEIDYLISNEWVMTTDDILWRRTKLGLILTNEQRYGVESYLKNPKN